MDLDDIEKVNELSREKQAIDAAQEMLDRGGRIIAMTVSNAPPPSGRMAPFMSGVAVPTGYIEYPPQMVDAIKTSFAARRQVIEQELAKLGVTGVPVARTNR